jgi:hypothetical protein
MDQEEYQQIIGELLYIARTIQPDILIQVNLLGRQASKPLTNNLPGAQILIQYLLSMKEEELRLE